MDDARREEIVSALEETARALGAKGYDEGVAIFKGLLTFLNSTVPAIETKEALRTTLETLPQLPAELEEMLPQAIRQLPQFMRYEIKMLSHTAASTLPSAGTGRPRAATPEKAQEVMRSITKLYESGCTLAVAKDRAAKLHGLSRRTVERINSQRGKIPATTVTLQDLISFLTQGDSNSPGERKIPFE
jgi:hypothetical protein